MLNKIKVPYLNLTKTYSLLVPDFQKDLLRVIKSGNVILGKELLEFEKEYASFSQTKYSAGVGNGLDALVLSLSALGVGKGDEVIVCSNTYIATVIAISRVGATPIFAEPKRDTYNLDPKNFADKITKKTKAVIPVHFFGQVCEMDKILKIAKEKKFFVIEDNAQSHGAYFGNRIAGSFGDINATSFYPGKNLGAIGDGGAITTNSKGLYEKVKILRNYGARKKYFNEVIGYNSRLDEIQAAFLKSRLKILPKINKSKIDIAKTYLKALENCGDLILPKTEKGSTHVYHVFPIRTKKRNSLQKYLALKNITTLIHYPIPPHISKAYKFLGYKKGDFPIAEELASTSLSLPIFPFMQKAQIEYVVESIKKFYK